MVPSYEGTFTAGTGFNSSNGWFAIGFGALPAVYYESNIDVNLDLDDLTMFPQAAILQDPGLYKRTQSVSEDVNNSLQVIDIVSIKRLNITQLVSELLNTNTLPGMLGTSDDFNQIVMGSWRLMAVNTNLGLQANIHNTIDHKDFSSASPFANDTLWCYRVLVPNMTVFNPGTELAAPASRFIIEVIVGQEEDLPYMMRLKNSYEIQQS
jgi:hypothetical protein